MKFSTNYTNRRETKGESNFGVSKTVSGESYTIKELVARQMAGTLPAIKLEAIYTGDKVDYVLQPQFKPNFDLSDLDKMRDKANYILRTMETQEKNSREAKKIENARILLKSLDEKEKELKNEGAKTPPKETDTQEDVN